MSPRKRVKIDKKYIGDGYPCFIVAELSGNHDGKLPRVFKLIDKAKSAGVDAIKIQAYEANTIAIDSKTKILKLKRIILE